MKKTEPLLGWLADVWAETTKALPFDVPTDPGLSSLFGLGGAVIFCASVFGSFLVAVYLPADHFCENAPAPNAGRVPGRFSGNGTARHFRFLAWGIFVGRNLLGGLLILLGAVLALPLVPGPGGLCLLLGVWLMEFPLASVACSSGWPATLLSRDRSMP